MGKLADLHIVLGETIDRLMEDKPSGTSQDLYTKVQRNPKVGRALTYQAGRDAIAQYKAWDSACMNLRSMRDGLIPIDEAYLWAVRDFFQMDRRLPREETSNE